MEPKSPTGRTATHLVFPLPSFPFLTHSSWAHQAFQAAGLQERVHWEHHQGSQSSRAHCEFTKHRQSSTSSCDELGAFVSFLLHLCLLAHPSSCNWLFSITSIMDAIVSLPLCSQFIWFGLFSLLTNYCLRGKKCSEPLSQSDLFWCSGCSFIKSILSLLGLLLSSSWFSQSCCLLLWVAQNVTTVRSGSKSCQAFTPQCWAAGGPIQFHSGRHRVG